MSDAIWIALIQNFTPTLTATVALIVSLRAYFKHEIKKKYEEGAKAGRSQTQRKTDGKEKEKDNDKQP